ncbi:hypothetical protein BCON_0224g00140 [Botryotinia convoluta]|uniref:Uncharacterized protein n=1 Tax=Botryotinia convoluta TaxID=54673 RepID=A0A4Z1HIX1_9HELO|nr:hypothetical protein BCON_0224g00140 [Botryotinia convoluta]
MRSKTVCKYGKETIYQILDTSAATEPDQASKGRMVALRQVRLGSKQIPGRQQIWTLELKTRKATKPGTKYEDGIERTAFLCGAAKAT